MEVDMCRASSSEHTMTDDEQETGINDNEIPHGLSVVQDRAIKNTLLELEQLELENELRNKFIDATESSQSSAKTNKANAKKCVPRSVPEFSGWCSDPSPKPKRADPKVKPSRDREVPRWESMLTKDYRPREISFVFKHHGDCRKYMEQYRKEHTYNYGPIGGMDVQILIPRVESTQKQNPLQTKPIREATPSASSCTKSSSRTRSESNILELARRYKFGASSLRTLQGSSIVDGLSKNSAQDPTTKSETDSDFDSSIANMSVKPQNLSTIVRSASEALSRLSELPTDKSSMALRGNLSKRVPVRLSPDMTESNLYGGNGKLLKRSSINGYSNDNQALLRITNNKSPNQVSPKHSLRTVDLLSHVSNVDKQRWTFLNHANDTPKNTVWFDASGRAYVSLATRYEPVRK